MKLVSFVIPVFNEKGNIGLLISEVISVMQHVREKYRIEIIFTDNHSVDRTYQEILTQSRKFQHTPIRVVRFSKNIGYQLSILQGYRLAEGDCAVQLDGDLQDPPHVVLQFLQKWEEGYDVVYGVRQARAESPTLTFCRKVFYRFMNKIGEDNFPVDAGDFRLVDKKIVDQLDQIQGSDVYLRGIIASMGFNQIGVGYERQARKVGESKFASSDLIRLALAGIFGHSDFPLRVARYVSATVSAITMFLAVLYVIGKVIYSGAIPAGFTTTTVLILISLSIVTFILSVLGEYLLRIFRHLDNPSQGIIESEDTNQKS